MSEQQEKSLSLPHFSLGQKAAMFGTTAPVTCVAVALVHAPPPLALGGIVGAYVLAHKSPQIYREMRKVMPFLPERSGAVSPRVSAATGEWSTWDRLMGRHLHDNVAPSAPKEAEREQPSSPEEGSYDWYDREDEDIAPRMDSSMFTFSQLLASGFTPSLHKIFLGRLTDGTDVFVEAKDLCHVALAGNTGNGKSSLLRLIMAQLCYIRVNVVLLNPHYMLYDRDHDEDWTPYTPYLARNPMDYVTPDNIAFMLKWIIEKTLMRRIDLARKGQSVGKPYFVVIDELPAIVAERKDVAVYVAKLLREGRKYGIFLIVASQDFLVKTTGMDDAGGAVRKCFRTACYVGGDLTTANVLLEKQAAAIPETELGKGKMMLRCSTTKQAVLASVPYCDNEALYSLLGPSTFMPEQDAPIYGQDAAVNAEIPIYIPVNEAVNGSVSGTAPLPQNQHLHSLVNVNAPMAEHGQAGEPSVNVNVSDEKREVIRRMNEMGGIPHNKIAKAVGLDGRHYPTYKAVCKEMGIATERES